MKTTDNTVLITGGGSGIGLAIASAFAHLGNRVIITGRNEAKLRAAAATLPNTTPVVADITNAAEVDRLVEQVKADFGGLNILVNNAGVAFAYQLSATADAYDKAKQEMEVNYFSVIRLTEKLLPLLAEQEEPAIVNISSVAAFVPFQMIATYSATKAALHSYTQTLRLTLEQTIPKLKVFEVFPPFVATDMTKDLTIPMLPPRQLPTIYWLALPKISSKSRPGQPMRYTTNILAHQIRQSGLTIQRLSALQLAEKISQALIL